MKNESVHKKVQAECAFWEISKKIKQQNDREKSSFFKNVIIKLSPIDYIDTHYNFSHEISSFKPVYANIIFDADWKPESNLNEGIESQLNDDPEYYVFFGDVVVHGNMKLPFNSQVYVTGNLIVDKVIEMDPDSHLIVGGTIKAIGGNFFYGGLTIVANEIQIRDVLLVCDFLYRPCNSLFYSNHTSCKLLLAENESAVISFETETHGRQQINLAIEASHRYLLQEKNKEKILSLFHPAFQKQCLDDEIDIIPYEIFSVLEGNQILVDENFEYVNLWA